MSTQVEGTLVRANDPVRQAINSIYAWAKLLRSGMLSAEQSAAALMAIEHNAGFILERWTTDDESPGASR